MDRFKARFGISEIMAITANNISETPAPAAARARAGRWVGARETWLLVALALVLETAIFFGFVLPYPLAGNYTTPLLDLAKITHYPAESANYFAVAWIVSFAAFYIAYRRCPDYPARAYLVVVGLGALVFCSTLLLMY